MRLKVTVEPAAWITLSAWLLLMPLQWVGAMMLAALIHELGHMAAVWLTDGTVYRICLKPFGAKIYTSPMEPRLELWCALAGPLAGGLVCLFFHWLPRTAVCALAQTVFNLLPVYPFDGGRAVRCVRQLWLDRKT